MIPYSQNFPSPTLPPSQSPPQPNPNPPQYATPNNWPKISPKKHFNAFNQSQNIGYQLRKEDVEVIVGEIVRLGNIEDDGGMGRWRYVGVGVEVGEGVGMGMGDLGIGERLVGVLEFGEVYIGWVMYWVEDRIVCQISHPANQHQILQKLQTLNPKPHLKSQPQLYPNFNPTLTSLFFLTKTLKISPPTLAPILPSTFPETPKQLLQYKQHLSHLYLSAKMHQYKVKSWSDWVKMREEQKREYLMAINPMTMGQLGRVVGGVGVGEDRLREEVEGLIKFCIDRSDCEFMKVVLRTGVFVTSINTSTNNKDNIQISPLSYTQLLLQTTPKTSPTYSPLLTIKKSLQKYGHTAPPLSPSISPNSPQTQTLKNHKYTQILMKACQENNTPIQLYQSFMNLLKAYLNSKITGILAATSSEVVMAAGTMLDSVTAKILGKVPYVGGILSQAYDSVVYACQAARKQHLMQFFSSPTQIQQILTDFSIHIIQTYSYQILNPIQKSLWQHITSTLNQKIKDYAVQNRVRYEFVVQGKRRQYGIDWEILCNRYLGQFLDYFCSEDVLDVSGNGGIGGGALGVRAALYGVEGKRVSKKELESIEWAPNYSHKTCCTLSKLLFYIQQYSRYPKSLSIPESPLSSWYDSELLPENLPITIKSIITVDTNKILIAYNINNQYTLSNNTALIGDIQSGGNLVEVFNRFVDFAVFWRMGKEEGMGMGEEVGEEGLGNLLGRILEKYGGKKVILAGYKLGGVFASLTRIMLVNDYKLDPEDITSYTFQQFPWCHQNSLEQAHKIFPHHYQIHLNPNPNPDPNQPQQSAPSKKYTKLGKILNLSNKLQLKDTSLISYIKNLDVRNEGGGYPDGKGKEEGGKKNGDGKGKGNGSGSGSGNGNGDWDQLREEEEEEACLVGIQEICEKNFMTLMNQRNLGKIKGLMNVRISHMKYGTDPQQFQQQKQQLLTKIAQIPLKQLCQRSFNPSLNKKTCQIVFYLVVNNFLPPKNITFETLCFASRAGHLPLIKYCIQKLKIEVNSQGAWLNPLSEAILGTGDFGDYADLQDEQFQAIRYLVEEAKADPNFKMEAKTYSEEFFIEKIGAKVGIGDIYPMTIALEIGSVRVVKYLVSKGCDVNAFSFRFLWNSYDALSLAIRPILMQTFYQFRATQYNKIPLIKYLIQKKGFKLNLSQGSGQIGNYQKITIPVPIIHYLLNHNLDPNYCIKSLGSVVDTLLLVAIRENDVRLAERLLRKGADPNLPITGYAFGSAMHSVCCKNGYGVYYSLDMNMLKIMLGFGGSLENRITGFIARFGNQPYKERLNKTPLDFLTYQIGRGNLKVRQYFDILKLHQKIPNQSLTYPDHYSTSSWLVANGFNYYTVSSFFTSEFLELQNSLTQQNATNKKAAKFRRLLDQLKGEFFQGDEKLQVFNKAMKWIFCYYQPKRFDQVLKICERYRKDEDFLFLESIVYLQLMNGTDTARTNHFKQKISAVLPKLTRPDYFNYIQAQLSNLNADPISAFQSYYTSISHNKYFPHPKVKLLNLLSQLGLSPPSSDHPNPNNLSNLKTETQILIKAEIEQKMNNMKLSFEELRREVAREVLPVDMRIVMEGVYERLETEEMMRDREERVFTETQSFNAALRQSFSVDVLVVKEYLERLLPEKIYTMSITYQINQKTYSLNPKKLLKSLDYAFPLLQSNSTLFSRHLTAEPSQILSHRQSQFYQPLTQTILKLQALKKAIQYKCYSKRDFKEERHQAIIVDLVEDLVEYYQAYVGKVVRSYLQDQDCNYLKFFYKWKGQHYDVCRDVRVVMERRLVSGNQDLHQIRGPYLLKNQVSEILTVTPPKTDQMYGTHKVVVLPTSGPNQIFYKYQPYAPGIEFAVSSLYNLILPNSAPQTTLLKLTKGPKSGLYLASKAITGRNFAQTINQPQLVKLIDMKNFSSLFLASFLVCTGDAKPDNFVMRFHYDGKGLVGTSLVSIDNDIAFYRNKLKVLKEGKKLYSDMLNILYLMPQMDQPVSPYLREYFNREQNQPQIIISKWLRSLYQKNAHYKKMKGFTETDLQKLKLPIKLPKGTSHNIYSTLTQILTLLSSQSTTHSQIFQVLSPSLSYFYNKCRDNTSVINSLKNIYAAAGADPSIVASLYSVNRGESCRAWNTLSEGRRKDQGEFWGVFDGEVEEEAEGLVGSVDFGKKKDAVLQAIITELYFVKKLILHNISQSQYTILSKFLPPTLQNLQIKTTPKFTPIPVLSVPQPSSLNLTSIYDILTLPNIPNNFDLIKQLTTKNLDINQRNQDGDTVMHEVVRLGQKGNLGNMGKVEKIIGVLLDCGVDVRVRNKRGESCLDLADRIPHVVLIIFSHKPYFFRTLIQNSFLQYAETIAKSMNSSIFTSPLQSPQSPQCPLVGQQTSILSNLLSNKTLKKIAIILLTKSTHPSPHLHPHPQLHLTQDLLDLFIQNYEDKDIDLLELLIRCGAKIGVTNREGRFPADQAMRLGKYQMVVVMVNEGGGLSVGEVGGNLGLIQRAGFYGIKLDVNDVVSAYDILKVNNKNQTLFELMTKSPDKILLNYVPKLLQLCQQNQPYKQKLIKLALSSNFIQLLQVLYDDHDNDNDNQNENKNGRLALYGKSGHILAKDQEIRGISRILVRYGFWISIYEARHGVNLYTKIDSKGNTILQIIAKSHCQNPDEQTLQDLHKILEYCPKCYLNFTCRPDKNTLPHLLIRCQQKTLLKSLLDKYPNTIDPSLKNCTGQTIQGYYFQVFRKNLGDEGLFQEKVDERDGRNGRVGVDQVMGMEFGDIGAMMGEIWESGGEGVRNLVRDLRRLGMLSQL